MNSDMTQVGHSDANSDDGRPDVTVKYPRITMMDEPQDGHHYCHKGNNNNNNNNNRECSPLLGTDDETVSGIVHDRGWHQHPRRHSFPERRNWGQLYDDDGGCVNDDDDDGCITTAAAIPTTSLLPSNKSATPSVLIPKSSSLRNDTISHANSNIHTKEMPPKDTETISNVITLSSLPIDALQSISTYCTPVDWYSLSSTAKYWRNGMGSEVLGRVRRHAGLCAFEVGMAWAMGEHADARELAGLYLSKGVPIYPAPRGHAYHTLVWRMGLELASTSMDVESERRESARQQTRSVGLIAPVGDTRSASDAEFGDRMSSGSNKNNDDANTNNAALLPPPVTDEFYTFRYLDNDGNNGEYGAGDNNLNNVARGIIAEEMALARHGFGRDGLTMRLTYVEEKSNFWKEKYGIEDEEPPFPFSSTTTGTSNSRRFSFSSRYYLPAMAAPQPAAMLDRDVAREGRFPDFDLFVEDEEIHLRDYNIFHEDIFKSSSLQKSNRTKLVMHDVAVIPKMTMRIHRHLYDQHIFGSPSIKNAKGAQLATVMSMNADFFHPTWEGRRGVITWLDVRDSLDQYWDASENTTDDNYERDHDEFDVYNLTRRGSQRRFSLPILSYSSSAGHRQSTINHALPRNHNPPLSSITSNIRFEIYSCANGNIKAVHRKEHDTIDRMRSLCQHYHQRLNVLAAKSFDAFLFEECLLDFWDEIFPTSSGIHFYNQQAPVPRMSMLHTFVTKPIRKALGTMQCEIERVKITGVDSKAATKRMKGKFFPKYEYRLFIRDSLGDESHRGSNLTRKDTVLLVAKPKRQTSSSVASNLRESAYRNAGKGIGSNEMSLSNSSTSKRGMSNYFLCLPRQCDIDDHYKSTNRDNKDFTKIESSVRDVSPLALQYQNSVEVGRLQSNFIGTDFQIFSPTMISHNMLTKDKAIESEPAHDAYKFSTSPRRSISRKGSELVRLAQRSLSISGRGMPSHKSASGNESAEETSEARHENIKKIIRRMSWGSSTNPTKWTNRRAIANDSEHSYFGEPLISPPSAHSHEGTTSRGEKEDGAITYTANLLGNRPRMMDVCIPKLTEYGRAHNECDSDRKPSLSMLDQFKHILLTLNSEENDDADNGNTSNRHDVMLLQNRPPWWNIELGAFVLNFGGRVKVASVKNFQLCERDSNDQIMQFGRIEGRHAFTMDFQYPLTPMQAFAIAISSLQSKISFG